MNRRRRRNQMMAGLDQDIRDHIERETEDNIARGMAPEEARRQALLKFGNVTRIKEDTRDVWILRGLEQLWQDARFGARMLRKSPGFTIVAVLTLALGIGANTTMFSVVNGVLLRPLAYRQSQQLYLIREIVPQLTKFYPTFPANLQNFRVWQQRARSFSEIAIAAGTSLDFTGHGPARQIAGAYVSASLFDTLGVRPEWGRDFRPEEDEPGRDHEVILTNSFWRSEFHGDPFIVGGYMTLDGAPYRVIGILPASFRFPGQDQLGPLTRFSPHLDFFKPLGLNASQFSPIGEFDYAAIARLKPGVSPEQALAGLNVIQAQIAQQAKQGLDLRARMIPLQAQVIGSARQGLLLLLAAVGAVLLIVCVNLANLLLARLPGRMHEAALRNALGATRRRLLRQWITESALLGVLGGALGVGLAYFGVRAIIAAAPAGIPRMADVALDARALGFAILISLLTVALFGILPAWQVARVQPQNALSSGSARSSENPKTRRFRSTLIGVEVALGTILLILAGLLTSSLARMLDSGPGFPTDHTLAADIQLPPHGYEKSAARKQFFNEALAGVRALPGVVAAAWVNKLPLEGEIQVSNVRLPGQKDTLATEPLVNFRVSSPGYFETIGIPLIAGRDFTRADETRDVAIVSRSLAERLWPGERVIGRKCIGGWGVDHTLEVIGEVGDIYASKIDEPPMLTIYLPHSYGSGWDNGQAVTDISIVMRTARNPESAVAGVRAVIRGIDPNVPITALRPIAALVEQSVEARQFQMTLALLFAGCAVFLAALGIFGVVAYSVEERRRELGIRHALGAQPRELRSMIMRQGMTSVLIGLAAGAGAAVLLRRAVQGLLFRVSASDPFTFAVAALAVVLVGLAACWIPARRAMRIDPMAALRHE